MEEAAKQEFDRIFLEFRTRIEAVIDRHLDGGGANGSGRTESPDQLTLAATMASDILDELHRMSMKGAFLDMTMALRIQTCLIMLNKALGRQGAGK